MHQEKLVAFPLNRSGLEHDCWVLCGQSPTDQIPGCERDEDMQTDSGLFPLDDTLPYDRAHWCGWQYPLHIESTAPRSRLEWVLEVVSPEAAETVTPLLG